MKLNLIAAGILSFALLGVGSALGAAPPSQSDTHYTQAQLKQMERDAHTPEQYNALAAYYGSQQQSCLRQAAEQKQESIRRSQNVMVVAAKYPRPVDSARYLYEYLTYKASEAAQLTAKYAQLAAPTPVGNVK